MAASNGGIVLGEAKEPLLVRVDPGYPFYLVLERLDGDFAAGSTLSLRMGADPTAISGVTVWSASIAGALATFDITAANAAAIPDGTNAHLVEVVDGRPLLWAKGRVIQDG